MTDEHEEHTETTKANFTFTWKTIIPWLSIVAIALGQLNDTWDGIEKLWIFGQSTMSDTPSKNRLNNIYINASSGVLEETFGSPVFIKESTTGNRIKYFNDKNFILSAITKDGIIAAYLVFPLDSFTPDTVEHAGGVNYLNVPFDSNVNLVQGHSNIARVGNYYIEEITGGKFDMLYSSVGGVSEYLGAVSPKNMKILADYNDKAMMEEDTKDSLKQLRTTFVPNFYGYSSVGIIELEQAIMTFLEFELITTKLN